jgi:hypothetical protein
MRKIFALVVLCVALASPLAAQTGLPPLCGISHTDYQTGEVICDDPPNGAQTDGISHTDAPGAPDAADDSTAAVVVMALLDVASTIITGL